MRRHETGCQKVPESAKMCQEVPKNGSQASVVGSTRTKNREDRCLGNTRIPVLINVCSYRFGFLITLRNRVVFSPAVGPRLPELFHYFFPIPEEWLGFTINSPRKKRDEIFKPLRRPFSIRQPVRECLW